MFYLAGSLLLISLFHAWRYSKTSVDPDWAYFNLWAFTGSVYGRDFADCKTPMIHLWYLGLSKLVGRNVARVKFMNHFILGSVGVVIYLLTGDYWGALTYTVLVNSGWLLAFHGNVGQIAAAGVALAFSVQHSVFSVVFWIVAVVCEPKLLPSFLAVVFIEKWYWVVGLVALLPLVHLVRNQQWFQWVWESSVIIPARMAKNRKGDFYKAWIPWFTSNGLLLLLPWLGLAVIAKLDFLYWLPALVYVVLIATGKIVRQNHLLPLVPFIAFSGMEFAWLLALVDFVSAGFYFGNIWARFYPALDELNADAEKIGAWLRDRPGTIYVNGIHSGVYIHAMRSVLYGFAEQIEIREVATERRERMVAGWHNSPPDYVVDGRMQGIRFKPVGYQRAALFGDSVIYRKVAGMR